ncbi:serine/threonine-protein kinase [Crossiella sp. CA-258035]|uniref:serine/threonine-protein kinase n=1 Tax=Crossiella sp. CA-258035 TaxID=2981138 RepID=UPI0024BC4AF0|nr:serine/threonine-protein kinase [Crossiella sp. CA-258035]WHT20664.1 serine/threonine-protein kinase [Crossiella sp. CA-258035]
MVSVPCGADLVAGRYRLGECLGTGGTAEVRRAYDTVLERFVAVKLFRSGWNVSAGRRFDNEVRTLAGLSHPGLVCVHDAGTSDGVMFLVLQLVEGDTLRDRMAGGPLPAAVVRGLGAQVAEALAYVHARYVVHRDVKPSNILFDAADNAHLADFGLAYLVGSTRLTRADEIVGTAAYLAPEQVRGTDVGPPADIYALGLVLLECLTGRQEYLGGEAEVAVARLHRAPAIPEDLPADLAQLLLMMTSLTPKRRPSAHDCARVLRGEQAVEPTLPVAAAEVARTPVFSRTALLTGAAALLGAIGVVWGATAGSGSDSSAPPPVTGTSTASLTTAPAAPPATSTVPTSSVPPPVVTVGQRGTTTVLDKPGKKGKGGKDKAPGQGKKEG